ncbi:hypothetical protein M2132_001760 [Dysgonomonas sp. PH5-45]|uniref:hypothetical protein n=1 Tax=unclassified Dysgonomonas TaxID=2630389 RepID=UPI002475D92C|nr:MULTISPECIES: hypothetical protein [unclassified Dysgonomonas]MDH6355418.1 hypothetical protein [Dysgonomonas sp. PH5-45]MDH6388315.1 hypothetical protein [Dysgonomonas sp. PH5-37]
MTRFLYITIFCLFFFCTSHSGYARGYDYVSDSIQSNIQHEDSLSAIKLNESYQDLKEKTGKNRWTKTIFSTLIRKPKLPNRADEKKSLVNEYKPYHGKIIRNINITVLPPFGTSVENPDERIEKFDTFNNLHQPTKKPAILRNLQFQSGDPVKSGTISESEAFLRSSGYIADARINIIPIVEVNDSVDVDIVVRDKWTIGAYVHKVTTTGLDTELFDKNILGSGSRAGLRFIYESDYSRNFGFGGNYLYKNLFGSLIDLQGEYLDKIKNYQFSASAKRNLQPKLNYFGEMSYSRQIIRTDIAAWDSLSPDYHQQFCISLGRAFTLPSDDAVKRFVISTSFRQKSPKYKNSLYQEHVKDIMLPYKYVENKIWLAQFSLYKNTYIREYLINNFGTTENIAQGYNLSLQLGYSTFRHFKSGMYTSFKAAASSSKIVPGNLYGEAAISSFFNKGEAYESVLKFESNYYSPLISLPFGRLRQFLTVNYTKLLSPDKYFGDRIYFGSKTNLGINEYTKMANGTEQFLVKTESDLYSRYEIAGFRFLFYHFFDMCWLSPRNESLFKKDNLYWGTGIGIRIKNDMLVFNTLDIKLGFYPRMDQNGFDRFFDIGSSVPTVSPNLVPTYPKEILLE